MTKGAYYNEYDAAAAAWLRELIASDLIAPGDVDERSITEVQASDLSGYTQCHFFAGIGVWSYALRCAGVPDSRSLWTASCPCPPFSSAGKKKPCPQCGGHNPVPHVGRTGFFICCSCSHEWLADGRHLFPELWRLVRDGRPDTLLGEQVASGDGRVWLATVRAALEILGYAVGSADTCAAGVGAPHIRQRLYFVAQSSEYGRGGWRHGDTQPIGSERSVQTPGRSHAVVVADTSGRGLEVLGEAGIPERPAPSGHDADRCLAPRSLGHAGIAGLQGHAGDVNDGHESGWLGTDPARSTPEAGGAGVVGDSSSRGRGELGDDARPGDGGHAERSGGTGCDGLGITNGERLQGQAQRQVDDEPEQPGRRNFWRDIRWHPCRDGKSRPVPLEPALFPLAPRTAGRVGLLRGAGNSLCSPQAVAFITAYLEAIGERST